ncbi:MAG: hypothetical protein KDA86_24485 [Planctomycetaceae bacterium]|nr:hypothetical protein [Planctomycetaceae bacterium]
MSRHNSTTRNRNAGSRLKIERLRCETALLRRDMDLYERLYSSWQTTRRQRDAQANARFNVIEAQLARLSAIGTMDCVSPGPSKPVRSQPVVYSIAAYRA